MKNLLKTGVACFLLALLAGCAIVPAYGPYAEPGVVVVPPGPRYYTPSPHYYGYRDRWEHDDRWDHRW